MARKRMFDLEIVDTDLFLEMPQSTQNLYFHLGMRADDDGFVSNPKKIIKIIGANEDDLKLLAYKQFVIPFENGICVIRHWKINNYLRKDRYIETIYKEEKRELKEDENGIYNKSGNNLVYQKTTDGIHSIEKNSIEEYSIEKNRRDIMSSKHDTVSKIIDYLNEKTSSNFKKTSKKTRELVSARLNEGYKEEDFITVIDTMVTHWLNDEKMCVYLRPETLFSNKFEGYLNRKPKKMTTNDLKIELGGLLDE